MRRAPFAAALVFAVAGVISPAGATAGDEDDSDRASAPAVPPESKSTAHGNPETPPGKAPPDAQAALVRAAAAYEYGDLNQVVESARFVTEGSLPSTQEQQAQAFRLLGIGLYLTNRPLGAEAAFTELLRRDPRARLDPTNTRPELVAFFESLRHQHLTRERSTRKVIWNFIPPVGQFQNGDNVKGWAVLTLGVLAGATCATSYALRKSWDLPGGLSKHEDAANAMKTVNIIGWGVVIATYVYGVFDGLIGYSKPIEDGRLPLSFHYMPGGGGLGFTF